jgi:hypothetical protein
MKVSPASRRAIWLAALQQRNVWARAAKIGLPVGCLQSVINQGDVWWHHQATGLTLAKTIISPLVTFSVALVSAAATWVEKQLQESRPGVIETPDADATRSAGPNPFSTPNSPVPPNEIVQV